MRSDRGSTISVGDSVRTRARASGGSGRVPRSGSAGMRDWRRRVSQGIQRLGITARRGRPCHLVAQPSRDSFARKLLGAPVRSVAIRNLNLHCLLQSKQSSWQNKIDDKQKGLQSEVDTQEEHTNNLFQQSETLTEEETKARAVRVLLWTACMQQFALRWWRSSTSTGDNSPRCAVLWVRNFG